MKFSIAFFVLLAVHKKFSFEHAVLVGLAMNSADINEARELITDVDRET